MFAHAINFRKHFILEHKAVCTLLIHFLYFSFRIVRIETLKRRHHAPLNLNGIDIKVLHHSVKTLGIEPAMNIQTTLSGKVNVIEKSNVIFTLWNVNLMLFLYLFSNFFMNAPSPQIFFKEISIGDFWESLTNMRLRWHQAEKSI